MIHWAIFVVVVVCASSCAPGWSVQSGTYKKELLILADLALCDWPEMQDDVSCHELHICHMHGVRVACAAPKLPYAERVRTAAPSPSIATTFPTVSFEARRCLTLYARLVLLHGPPVSSLPERRHLTLTFITSSPRCTSLSAHIYIYIILSQLNHFSKETLMRPSLVWYWCDFRFHRSRNWKRKWVYVCVWLGLHSLCLSHPLNVQHGAFRCPRDGSDLTTVRSVPHAGNPSHWDNKLGLTAFIKCAIFLYFRPTSSFYEQNIGVIT